MPISHEYLRSMLRYNATSGQFLWIIDRGAAGARAGAVAGSRRPDGYIAVEIDGRAYKAHRLAWFYVNGSWPEKEIDHINRDKSDNRIANLRDVVRSVNRLNVPAYKNNKTGMRGITFRNGKYNATVTLNGRQRWLGTFQTADDALAVRAAAIEAISVEVGACLSPL